ncbi:Uncharacterised protein (plasmid) [Tsukamurella tyrosinosolvens]|uniref:Uncharacterized protein n=1 Tax=Tsukamurella tyrosinosolvens TaxID=57704 RepID=A0A1H4V1T2_TSUTY|nr:hypothetical protein [Tsukamurella tyrosinosolvens]SEC74895.1 hypothetical protein SAMN04489793_3111 [Tsukamurella tyrosinosolvens]VEH90742.1 Uncharacterised protein [Tsukamurella tyrosinosolvens]
MPGRIDPDGVCIVCDITFVSAIVRDHAAEWSVEYLSDRSSIVVAETCSSLCRARRG